MNYQETATFIYHTTAKYVPVPNMPPNATHMAYAQITRHAFMVEVCQYIFHI